MFQAVKLKDDGSEKEEFFCEEHGQEYAARGHLVNLSSVRFWETSTKVKGPDMEHHRERLSVTKRPLLSL